MIKQFRLFSLIIFTLVATSTTAQAPFSRGVNITGWFQASGPRQIQFSQYSKKDFENIKSLGCDAIRLPVNLFHMTSGNPDYTIDPLFLSMLDQALDWAEELRLYLIIDNHTSDDLASQNPNLETTLVKVWTQLANRYKDRSDYILYEIMNEPNGSAMTTQKWGQIQQSAINAIRLSDTRHTIIVGGAGYNSYNELAALPVYTDNKLIYTFHFYDPFVFTHQGASWPSPSMISLANVPFPYNASTMPAVPSDLVGTWVGSALNNYKNEGTVAKIKSLIDIAVAFRTARNIKLYCGEFGVYIPNSKNTDRCFWYSEVRKYLEEKNIAWTIWDYKGGFGLFEKGSNEDFRYDVNISLIQALGLTEPPQQTYVQHPDSVGFSIYTDYIGENISDASYASGGTVDFYSVNSPNYGRYCLMWSGSNQYGTVGFNFTPDKDLSQLRAQNYALSMMIKGDSPGAKFQLRFTDTKTAVAGDHPWRMNFTVDETIAAWDNKWHKVFIPLTRFAEGGSWDNGTWYNPTNSFDWKSVDQFSLVAEQAALTGKTFWLDNIQISNMDTARVNTGIVDINSDKTAVTVYPNPAVDYTSIQTFEEVHQIVLFNISGIPVKKITGSKTVPLGDIPPGIYMAFIQYGNQQFCSKKIIRK